MYHLDLRGTTLGARPGPYSRHPTWEPCHHSVEDVLDHLENAEVPCRFLSDSEVEVPAELVVVRGKRLKRARIPPQVPLEGFPDVVGRPLGTKEGEGYIARPRVLLLLVAVYLWMAGPRDVAPIALHPSLEGALPQLLEADFLMPIIHLCKTPNFTALLRSIAQNTTWGILGRPKYRAASSAIIRSKSRHRSS
ncbi:hypothetical protein Cgig2_009920 [Carnegiea gigantea]|uniref:Uncharacterized protein n=1 Tax=Carnegiea gigantea TaxID=171969 RepID=A0A9Q1K3X8_9CARY|nr:hypothetical protein Cgig2_009920 [Carnegiea gigantea]